MKKKEIRWLSRDDDGRYDTWSKQPKEDEGGYICSQSGTIITREATEKERLGIILQRRRLAKITIERQY